jgi:hypothetical protein
MLQRTNERHTSEQAALLGWVVAFLVVAALPRICVGYFLWKV